jgi:hypothetical protein
MNIKIAHQVETFKADGSRIQIMVQTWFSKTVAVMYEMLDAQEFNGGISGIDKTKEYSIEDLVNVKNKYNLYLKGEDYTHETYARDLLFQTIREVLPNLKTITTDTEEEPNWKQLDKFVEELQCGEPLTLRFY